jgi:hypothetical protein
MGIILLSSAGITLLDGKSSLSRGRDGKPLRPRPKRSTATQVATIVR